METLVPVVKYIFVVVVGAEVALILRALYQLAREKGAAALAAVPAAEE